MKVGDEIQQLFYFDKDKHTAHTKFIPFYYMSEASVLECINLLKGYFLGDGYKRDVVNKGRLERYWNVTSVSKTLLVQVKRILSDIGIASVLSHRGSNNSFSLWAKGPHFEKLALSFGDSNYTRNESKRSSQKVYKDFVGVKIREIEKYESGSLDEDFVYSIEVE